MKATHLVSLCLFFSLLSIPIAEGQEIRKNIYFATNEYTLDESSKVILDSFCREIMNMKGYSIHIVGHTDSIASNEYNLILSQNRAKSVKDYMLSKGLDKNRISLRYLGENKPLVENSDSIKRQKNRRVEIIVECECIKKKKSSVSNKIKSKKEKNVFENDTIIYCAKGAIIEIESCAFYPHKMKDIQFNIEEYYSTCELFNSPATMLTDSGDCLTSGGFMFINLNIGPIDIQPNEGYTVKVKIPAGNNNIDQNMTLYTATQREGETVWSNTDIELKYENKLGVKYYVFELASIVGINIDKPIVVRCEDDGPCVKIRGYKKSKVYLTYPDEMYLSNGAELSKRLFSLVKVAENKVPVLTVVSTKKLNTYVATGPLLDLKYKSRKNMFVVKKKYFRLMDMDNRNGGNMVEDLICKQLQLSVN